MIGSLARLRFTLIFLAVMLLANVLAGTFSGTLPQSALAQLGVSRQTLGDGQFYRLFTAVFLSHNTGMLFRQFLFAAIIIGLYEILTGTRRTLLMFTATDLIGTVFLMFAIIGPLSGWQGTVFAGADQILDVGMSAGGFGLIGAVAALMPWRHAILGMIAAGILVKLTLWPEVIADCVHLVTLCLGFALGRIFPLPQHR